MLQRIKKIFIPSNGSTLTAELLDSDHIKITLHKSGETEESEEITALIFNDEEIIKLEDIKRKIEERELVAA